MPFLKCRFRPIGASTLAAAVLLLVAPGAAALDPPHDASWSIDCSSCHTTHNSPGGALTTVGGNGNLCLSCHMIGSIAAGLPFVDADQALPSPGLPPGTPPSGTSHRWDSGPAGHVKADGGSILSVIGLFANKDSEIIVEAVGDDAEEALDGIEELVVRRKFDEE